MKRIKANNHTLHVLMQSQPKLRKGIISNRDRDLVNCISECILNVLNGNIALTDCDTRIRRNHKVALRKLLINKSRYRHETTYCSEWRIPSTVMAAVLPTLTSLIAAK